MSWESCILLFNSDSSGRFLAGDIVTGSVILEFVQEQKIDRIDFDVIGLSKAQWTRSMPSIPYIKNYSEKRKILKYNIDVFRELNGKKVQPGICSNHFHFILPDDLPSTFKSSLGKVEYYIKVTGKAACKLRKHKFVPFVVHANVNVNHISDYLVPISFESQKQLRKSRKVSICIKTYTTFSPTQSIPFEVVIVNENKVKISKIYIFLVQKVHYTVKSGYADEEKIIYKFKNTRFSNTLTETCRFDILVPQTIPSSIYLTDPMIDISYLLRVVMKFTFHSTLYEEIPVTVAEVPVLHQEFETSKYNKNAIK